MKASVCWLVLCALLPLSGCYTYAALPAVEVTPGNVVRARITPDEADRLRPFLGREDRLLIGRLRALVGDSLLLDVPAATVSTGGSTSWLSQGVSIPRSQLVEVEVRRLDRWRTAGLVALGALAAGVLASEAFDQESAAPPAGPGKGGSDAWIGSLRTGW